MTTFLHDTEPAVLETLLDAAAEAAIELADRSGPERAAALRAVAAALDAATDELVRCAAAETSLPTRRLTGEIARTTGQLRMFADGLDEGSYLDIVIDTRDERADPVPRPDLRRMQIPRGPVLVFAASNFPFAFSVAGGDTASALAAGCPVIVKAHPGHPRTSERTGTIVAAALAAAGMPAGSFTVLYGQQAGVTALRDPRIRAASFTGSLHGGRTLFDIANDRSEPIPFYAEMGSLNPVFVSQGAVHARGESISDGYVASFTLGVGQFCTKPGLLFVPAGHGLGGRLAAAVKAAAPGRMLIERIHQGHRARRDGMAAHSGVRTLVHGELGAGNDAVAGATLLATDVATLLRDSDELLTECFGPTSIVVEYDGVDEAVEAARAFSGNLTATVHAQPEETEFGGRLLRELRERAGRLVWNGWPTGVAVAWAMHHGGPYPATTAPEHTSVGMTAIRRFLRPVCYQDWPHHLLPAELRDTNADAVPRRINGTVTTDDVAKA